MNTNNEDYRAGFNFIKVCRFLAYLLLALGTWGSFIIVALSWFSFSQVSAERKISATTLGDIKYSAGFLPPSIMSVGFNSIKTNETELCNALRNEINQYNESVADIHTQQGGIETLPLLYVTQNHAYYSSASFKIALDAAKRDINQHTSTSLCESSREALLDQLSKIEETISQMAKVQKAPAISSSIDESDSYSAYHPTEEKSYTATESMSQSPDSEEEDCTPSSRQEHTHLPAPPQLAASTGKTVQTLPTVFLAVAMLSGSWLSWALMLVFCDFAEAHLQTAKNSRIIIDLLKGNKS